MTERDKIGLTELVAEIGDAQLTFQVLGSCLEGQQTALKRGGTRFSFGTNESLTAVIDGTRAGIIIWVDQVELDAAMVRLRAKKTPNREG